MSSILKALKKIEGSGQEGGPLEPSLPYGAPSLRSSWRRNGWYSGRNAFYLLSIGLVSVIVVAAYSWWAGGGSTPTAGGAKEVRAPLPSKPADQTSPDVSPPARSAPLRPAAAPPPPAETVTDSNPNPPQARAAPSVQAPPPTSRVRPREGSAAPPPAEARPPQPRNMASASERAGAGRPTATRSAEDSLSRLDEAKLKVMAIAWAEDPARRLAVLNGYIVKEGESVEGFSVTQIRKDDVIVNDGSRSWRVELNLKTQP